MWADSMLMILFFYMCDTVWYVIVEYADTFPPEVFSTIFISSDLLPASDAYAHRNIWH